MTSGRHLQGSLDLMLLTILADEPGHGYAVISRLKQRSHGTFDLAEGTVYPALHKLEQQGAIASSWDTSSGRRRRIYAITKKGRESLVEHRREWLSFSQGMLAVIGAPA